MKKNILLLLFISLLHTTCVWGMDNKTDQHKKITVKQFSNPFVNEEFVCIAILVFFPLKPLLVLRLTCKRLSNYVAKFTHNYRSLKVREPTFCECPDGPKTKEKRKRLLETIKNSNCKIELSLTVMWLTEPRVERICEISSYLYYLEITNEGHDLISCVNSIKQCVNLKKLRIQGLTIPEDRLSEMLNKLTKLQELNLAYCCNIIDISPLPFPPTLKSLSLPERCLSSEGEKTILGNIEHLKQLLTKIEKLSFSSSSPFYDPEVNVNKENSRKIARELSLIITLIFEALPSLKKLVFVSHVTPHASLQTKKNMAIWLQTSLPKTLLADAAENENAILITRNQNPQPQQS